MTGAYEVMQKWMRGYGIRLVWNSVTSTFRAPSKRSDAVSEEMTYLRVSCGSRRAVVTGLRSASNLERRRPLGCSSQAAAAARWPLGVFLRLSSE